MSTFTPQIVHPEVDMLRSKESDAKHHQQPHPSSSSLPHGMKSSPSNDADIARSEGEGMGTSSYHNAYNTQSQPKSSWFDEKKLSRRLSDATHSTISAINETDRKMGFSRKINEMDAKYGVTSTLERTGKKINDMAVHFGRSLSRGQVRQAFRHSVDAARIGECERRKHDPKGLGPPQWIAESDTEGLVWESRGKGPTLNERLEKEAAEMDAQPKMSETGATSSMGSASVVKQ